MAEHITGYYVRVKRDNRWHSLDFATLTNEEMDTVLQGRNAAELIRWVIAFGSWIRDNTILVDPSVPKEGT